MSGNERNQAEFNMAVSYLNRLNVLISICDDASMSLDMNQWMHSLMALFRELSTEMTDKEIENIQASFNHVNTHVQEINQNQIKRGKVEVEQDPYNDLHNIEIKLRKVLKDSGLQMKMKQSASSALEG